MQLAPPPAPTAPQKFGRLVEHDRGAPEHGAFVLARTTPTDGSAPLEYSTRGGTRMWRSPDDDVPRVLGEAVAVARATGQALAIITAEPGHWQQLFVLPLFRLGAAGALDAVRGVDELRDQPLLRSGHLVGFADAAGAIDVRAQPVTSELMPPRARPGAH